VGADELVELAERAGINEHLNALPARVLAARVELRDSGRSAPGLDARLDLAHAARLGRGLLQIPQGRLRRIDGRARRHRRIELPTDASAHVIVLSTRG
jgi:hypothetical protein